MIVLPPQDVSMKSINKYHFLPDKIVAEAAVVGDHVMTLEESAGGLIHPEFLATHAADVTALSSCEVVASIDGLSTVSPAVSLKTAVFTPLPALPTHGSVCHG
jgi:hypothetical protein